MKKKEDYKKEYLSVYRQIEELHKKEKKIHVLFLLANELQNEMEKTNNYLEVAICDNYIVIMVYSDNELSLARKLIKGAFEEWADNISQVSKINKKVLIEYKNSTTNEILNLVTIQRFYENESCFPKSIIGDNCKFEKVKYEQEVLVCKK